MKATHGIPRMPLAAAMLLAVTVTAAPTLADEEAPSEGQQAFVENKCNNCHSIDELEIERKLQSEKMKGPDLGDVGERHIAEWIVKFVKREVDLDDNLHKQEYKGTEEDLQAIASWLVGLSEE